MKRNRRSGGARLAASRRPVMYQEQAMSDEHDPNQHNEMRVMWIFSAAVVLLILGMMGANVLFHKGSSGESTEISSQSRSAPTR
jgi:hypothetical protein